MSDNINNNPEHREAFIRDELKRRGKHHAPVELPPEVKLAITAKAIWDHVTNHVAVPMLRALKSADGYIPAGTQFLLKDQFCFHFNKWSKDELVVMIAMMHAEELEKVMSQQVNAGLFGPDMDKES